MARKDNLSSRSRSDGSRFSESRSRRSHLDSLTKDPDDPENGVQRTAGSTGEASVAPTSGTVKKRHDAWIWGIAIVVFVAILIACIAYMIWRKKSPVCPPVEDDAIGEPVAKDCETLTTEPTWQPSKRKLSTGSRIGNPPSVI